MKTSETRTATGAKEDEHPAGLGHHMPRAEPECAYLENEPDEKKLMVGSLLNPGV
ncbi:MULTISPECIES: hypothetical protein [Pseudomonas]|uniref:Uncharacterized protein n=2 Tax=Pseudomonas brassicacearum TaxID=930166 RepID=A0AAJ3FT58_9PSED|nr:MULTISPECIES: hypothetical protein [Pseudomonas]NUT79931.1 hypothetical protein [Pseudomonas brassicacearum]